MGPSKWRKPSAYLRRILYYYRPYRNASSKGTYHFNARDKNLRLVSDMPDSNRNWKSRYFFVEGTNWVCRQEEWATMPHGYFDNTWAFVRDSGQSRQPCSFHFLSDVTNNILFSSAYTRPRITDEQEEFIRRVLEIPLEERKCRDLITLDTIHLYCGGPEPSTEARRLEEFSRRRE